MTKMRPEHLVGIKNAFGIIEGLLRDGREWVLGTSGPSLGDIEGKKNHRLSFRKHKRICMFLCNIVTNPSLEQPSGPSTGCSPCPAPLTLLTLALPPTRSPTPSSPVSTPISNPPPLLPPTPNLSRSPALTQSPSSSPPTTPNTLPPRLSAGLPSAPLPVALFRAQVLLSMRTILQSWWKAMKSRFIQPIAGLGTRIRVAW